MLEVLDARAALEVWNKCTAMKRKMTRIALLFNIRDGSLLQTLQWFKVEAGDDDDDLLGNDKPPTEYEATNNPRFPQNLTSWFMHTSSYVEKEKSHMD